MSLRLVLYWLLIALSNSACSGEPNESPQDAGLLVEASTWDGSRLDGSGRLDAADTSDSSPNLDGSRADVPDGALADASVGTGRSVWVGVGNFGLIASTEDGVSWRTQGGMGSGNPHTPDLLRAVGFGGGVFIAVGGHNNSYILRSSDGVRWQDSGSQTSGPWLSAVTHSAGVWIAAGEKSVLRSTDNGLTWNRVFRAPGGTGSFRAAGSDPRGNFIVGGDNGSLFVSEDRGQTFTNHSVSTPGRSRFEYLFEHNGRWVGAGRGRNAANNGFDSCCFVSDDMKLWTPCSFSFGEVMGGSYQHGEFHLFSQGARAYSVDGRSWLTAPSNVHTAFYGSLGGGGGMWVAKRYGNTLIGPDLGALSAGTGTKNFRSFVVGIVFD